MGQHSGYFSMGEGKYLSFVVSQLGPNRWHLWLQYPGERVSTFTCTRKRAMLGLRVLRTNCLKAAKGA